VTRPLPPPLPPAERTVGQVVAEAIRLYSARWAPSLALGLPIAFIDQASEGRSLDVQTLILWAGTPLLTASFVGAVALAAEEPIPRRSLVTAFLCGLLVFSPVPVLVRLYVLPALAWLALFGMAVPAAALERLSLRAALRRGRQLAAADYVHALGSLCALGIVYFIARAVLFFLLRGQADAAERAAAFLGDVAVSPLLYLGAALVYFDQAARLSLAEAGGKIRAA
jgi:hypothetical protein